MKTLVTGSSGMVGSSVARLLELCGDTVVRADLKHGEDLRNFSRCFNAAIGCERVFHLADRTVGIGYSSTNHGQMLTDSLLISLNMLEAARRSGVRDYLYVSSSCVYPDGLKGTATEDLASEVLVNDWPGKFWTIPERANAGYGWAKRIGELQATYYAREYGMRTVIVRPSNIYGPSYDWKRPIDDMHVIPALIAKMLRGDKEIVVWGSGRQTRTFQYEEDVAKLMIELMDKGKSGEAYNLGGVESPVDDLISQLAPMCGWTGVVKHDLAKPEGPLRKAQDTSKLNALKICAAPVPLINALAKTVEGATKCL